MGDPKLYATCRHCGGGDVLADAYAWWNSETQKWELENTYDKGAFCNDCDGETRIVMSETKPPERDDCDI